MRLVWLTDIHLDFVQEPEFQSLLDDVRSHDPAGVLIGGDIAQAPTVCTYLARFESALSCPVYFVLGNHDYYRGSIASVRAAVAELTDRSERLCWLNTAGAVRLTDTTCLVGHDGWGDARLGDFEGSGVLLNDFLLIEELTGLPRQRLREELQRLGDETAAHFRSVLPEALRTSEHVVVLTHVPPFREAAWHQGRPSDDDFLPFFACKAAGDVLRDAMLRHPAKGMTVLCGHTHGGGTSEILANLICHTAAADYGRPAVQGVFGW
jgi:predicted phosphohydrolase